MGQPSPVRSIERAGQVGEQVHGPRLVPSEDGLDRELGQGLEEREDGESDPWRDKELESLPHPTRS